MEFKSVNNSNATEYFGKPIVFQLSGKPMIAKLRKVKGDNFVISSNGTEFLLSTRHSVVAIIDKGGSTTGKKESVHYPMNFLQASTTNVNQFLGHYTIVRTDKKSIALAKIRGISKSLQHIDIENGMMKQIVDIRHVPCYVIV
jgi:hypothetical protein